MITGID